jgi:hypothetical protein
MTEAELTQHKNDFPKSRKKNIESWPGDAALTYIEECNMERRLGRSISDESNARPLLWGSLAESKAFELLGLEYTLNSQDTISHPKIPYWSGSADGFKYDEGKTVIDIKCPWTLKSFCQLADCKTIEEVRKNHKDGEKFYYQLVSNAVINDCKYAELIIYMPYFSELDSIRDMASNYDGIDQGKFIWVTYPDTSLPYIHDGGYYKNIHKIRFEVPKEDKILLTDTVLRAGKLLEPFF